MRVDKEWLIRRLVDIAWLAVGILLFVGVLASISHAEVAGNITPEQKSSIIQVTTPTIPGNKTHLKDDTTIDIELKGTIINTGSEAKTVTDVDNTNSFDLK